MRLFIYLLLFCACPFAVGVECLGCGSFFVNPKAHGNHLRSSRGKGCQSHYEARKKPRLEGGGASDAAAGNGAGSGGDDEQGRGDGDDSFGGEWDGFGGGWGSGDDDGGVEGGGGDGGGVEGGGGGDGEDGEDSGGESGGGGEGGGDDGGGGGGGGGAGPAGGLSAADRAAKLAKILRKEGTDVNFSLYGLLSKTGLSGNAYDLLIDWLKVEGNLASLTDAVNTKKLYKADSVRHALPAASFWTAASPTSTARA
jgi:hypothetical protein